VKCTEEEVRANSEYSGPFHLGQLFGTSFGILRAPKFFRLENAIQSNSRKEKTFGAWSTRVVAKGLKNIHETNCTSRALWQEVHLAEIFFYPHKLLQNPSTFSVGYVRTSGAATKHKYLQQDLQLCKVSLLQPNFPSTCGMKQRCESAFAEDTMVSESFSR